MILPCIRARISWQDILVPLDVLRSSDPGSACEIAEMAEREGLDAALAEPRMMSAVLQRNGSLVSTPSLPLYLLVASSDALGRRGVDDVDAADYLASLIACYDAPSEYLADSLERLDDTSSPWEKHRATVETAEHALWLTGVLHERLRSRCGEGALRHADGIAVSCFERASASHFSIREGLQPLYACAAHEYPAFRGALNDLADNTLFPSFSALVNRMLGGPDILLHDHE